MSIKKESSGRRSVQVEVEVPGTPEEVWKAISTGPGISAWFVPTKVEERLGGKNFIPLRARYGFVCNDHILGATDPIRSRR